MIFWKLHALTNLTTWIPWIPLGKPVILTLIFQIHVPFLEVSFSLHDLHKTADRHHHHPVLTQCLPRLPQVQTTPTPLHLHTCISHSNLLLLCCCRLCLFHLLIPLACSLFLNFHINVVPLSLSLQHMHLQCRTCVVDLVAYTLLLLLVVVALHSRFLRGSYVLPPLLCADLPSLHVRFYCCYHTHDNIF